MCLDCLLMETGTVRDHPGFNAHDDAGILRKAMKGFGTDEKAIIDVLTNRSNRQRQEIKIAFKTMYGKDLIKELKSELGGNFEDLILALLMIPEEFDAKCLHDAMAGAGTDESALIEIMCSRSNDQIRAISAAYQRIYGKSLEKQLASETSGHSKRLFVSLSTGGRQENVPVDPARAKTDAKALFEAGEGRWGTDESKFNQVLLSQSYEQLRLVFREYANISNKSIVKAIESEMSGDLQKGLITVTKVVESRPLYFAERLYKAMKGAGTKDNALIRVIVSRCEVDMVQIKQEFMKAYNGKTLEGMISGDASGDYKRGLLSLVK